MNNIISKWIPYIFENELTEEEFKELEDDCIANGVTTEEAWAEFDKEYFKHDFI